MMDVQRVEQALIGVLRGIGAIKAVYTATDDPAGRTWPVAVVSLQSVSPGGDVDEADFGVSILTPLEGRSAHASWDRLMAAVQSVADAVKADPMLGGLAVWAQVVRTDLEFMPSDAQPELGRANLLVRVATRDWALPPASGLDPVDALRLWVAGRWSHVQQDPAAWVPSDDAPGLYWRLAAVQGVEPTVWGAWVTAQVQAHILAPSVGARRGWTRALVDAIAMDRRCPMQDGSPLFFESVSADSEADPVRTGQVQLALRFGITNVEQAPPLLRAVLAGALPIAVEVT